MASERKNESDVPTRPLIYVNVRKAATCECYKIGVVTRTKSLHRRRARFPLNSSGRMAVLPRPDCLK